MARYTPNVGKWHLRAVTLQVTAMIAGGQTVIILCNALCATHSHTTTVATTPSDVAQNTHHHHPSDNQTAASPDRDVNASTDHAHEQAVVSTTEIPPDPHTLLSVSSADCCATLDSGPATLATARADNIVLLASSVTAFIDAIALDSSHRQLGPRTHAPPAGELSSARTPLPLRI